MLETFSSITSSWFQIHASFSENEEYFSRPVEEVICCPQPRRTASPALVSSFRLRNNRVEADWEECEEIKQILLQGQLPVISIEKTTTTKLSVTADIPERAGSISFNPFFPTQSPLIPPPSYRSEPGKLNLETENFIKTENDNLLDSSDSDNDLNDLSESCSTLGLNSQFARRKALRRPKLGVSTSNLAGFERTEPVMTPPLRTHNPLPLNLQFRKVSEGAEFGLFSISPPSHDDEDVLLRRERFKRKSKGNELPHHTVPSQLVYQQLQDNNQEMSDVDILHNDLLPNDVLMNNDCVGGDVDVFGNVFDVELAR